MLFRSLAGLYKWISDSTPVEIHLTPFDVLANDLAERKALHENKPYKFAWNADKTWLATVTRQEIVEDEEQHVSTIHHSFHLHHTTLFKGVQ
jgi:hypothetical protein